MGNLPRNKRSTRRIVIITNRPTPQEIAARAYELYLHRGCHDGHDVDDWMQAEYELMQLPVHKLAELEPPPKIKGRERSPSLVEVVRAAIVPATK